MQIMIEILHLREETQILLTVGLMDAHAQIIIQVRIAAIQVKDIFEMLPSTIAKEVVADSVTDGVGVIMMILRLLQATDPKIK